MTVEWPDWRAQVTDALEVLAAEPPTLGPAAADPRWPDLTNSVHWLVDDTDWDHRDPSESVGTILRDAVEASTIARVVALVVAVSARQGATGSDAAWFADEAWPLVRAAARDALAQLRPRPDDHASPLTRTR